LGFYEQWMKGILLLSKKMFDYISVGFAVMKNCTWGDHHDISPFDGY